MQGRSQLDASKGEFMSSTDVQAVSLETSYFTVLGNLEIGNHGRSGPFPNDQGVTKVVPMSVRDKDVLRIEILRPHIRHRIPRQERIDEETSSTALDAPARVAVPSGDHRHGCLPPSRRARAVYRSLPGRSMTGHSVAPE